MAPPIAPAVAKVALTVDRDSRKFVNTFHVARADNAVLTATNISDIATAFKNWWDGDYRHILYPNFVGDNVTVTKLDPSDPLQVTQFLTTAGDYAVGGNVLPADVTSALSWRTGLAGRKNRGRFYHFGPASAQVTVNDLFTGGFQSAFIAVAGNLIAHLSGVAMKAVIFHALGNNYTPIIGWAVDQLVDSMRTRLPGRGT